MGFAWEDFSGEEFVDLIELIKLNEYSRQKNRVGA